MEKRKAKEKVKTTGFFFKASPQEMELLERRMAQTGIKNKSAFILKMCIDGHVFNLDLATLGEIKRLLAITSNNANQLARAVNSGGMAYREDVDEVNNQLTEIRTQFGDLLSLLSEAADAKPGKLFIPPPNIRDYYDVIAAKQAEENTREQSAEQPAAQSEPPTVGEGA